MKKLIVIITVFLSSVTLYYGATVSASPMSQYGYLKETNMDWAEVCSPTTLAPYQSGFYPTSFPPYVLVGTSTFRHPNPIEEYMYYLQYRDMPEPYVQEGFDVYPSGTNDMCVWDAFVEPGGYPGGSYETASSAAKDFVNNIEFADVSFAYSCTDYTGLMWRPYSIETYWSDGLTTEVSGSVCSAGTEGVDYISKKINPRAGRYISRIQLVFDTIELEVPIIGVPVNILPMPTLLIDRILIRGFYREGTPFPTSTPPPTRTPTITPTPTTTTTPRPIWNTPTPGVITATKQFPARYGSVPTRIPTVRWPAWPSAVSLGLPTPSWSINPPLLATPLPVSPTVTLAPFDWTQPISIYTPIIFSSGNVVTPTATATPTPTTEPPYDPCPLINNYSFDDGTGWTLYYGASISDGHLVLPGSGANAYQVVSFDAGDYGSVISVTSSASTEAWITINSNNLGKFYPTGGGGLYYATNTNVPAGSYILSITNAIGGELVIDEMCTANLADPTPTPTATVLATATRADIIGQMDYLSNQLQIETTAMQTVTTFTIAAAPAEYAPALPRNIANVGYTIETMDANAGLGFGVTAWASLFGYVISLPFQLVKMLYNLMQMLGPVRLFIIWLLVLLPFALWVRLILFIKNLIISLINLLVKIVRFIGDIWDLIPGL